MDLQQVLSSLERADAAGDTQAAQELANLARSLMAGQAPQIQTPPAIIPQTGFIPSVKRGALGIQSLFGDVLPAMAGKAVGAEDYAKKQLEEAAQAQKDIQARYPSEVPSYTDIKDVGTALTYIKESIGEAIPSMIPSLITGGAASLLAKPAQAVAIKAAETFAAEELAKAAAKNVISKEALDQIKQAAIQKGTQEAQKIGLQATAAGALTGSAAQNIPDVYQNIYEKTGQTDLGAALVAGGFNAALDAITPFRILSKFNKTGLTPQELIGAWYKRAGKGAAEGLLTEGATETLQEVSSAAAENFVAQNPDFFTKENFERFVNAGLKGAVGGAAITGATNVVAGRAEPKPEAKPEVTPDVTSKVKPEVTPELEQLTPEQKRILAQQRAVVEPPEDVLGGIQKQIQTAPPTTPEDIARIKDEHETAIIEGLLNQDAERIKANEEAQAQIRQQQQQARSQIQEQSALETMDNAIAGTDARVRESRLLSRVQDLIESNTPFASTAINDINAKFKLINEAPLTEQERARVQNIMGMAQAFTNFVNLPQAPVKPVDTFAENQQMEQLIKERKAREQLPAEPIRATPAAPSPVVQEAPVSQGVGEGAAPRPPSGTQPSTAEDSEFVAPRLETLPDEEPFVEATPIEGEPMPESLQITEARKKAEEQTGVLEADIRKLQRKPISLWTALRGRLTKGDVSEISSSLPHKALISRTGGTDLTDLVSDGALDMFLPYNMRPDSPRFDAQESAEYIKEKVRQQNYYTHETEVAIKQLFGSIDQAESEVRELLGIEDANKILEQAAADQRAIDQEAEQAAAEGKGRVDEERIQPEVTPTEPRASLRGKAAEQVSAFEQSLRTLLNKFGLKEIGLKLSEGMRDEGSYAAKLIQIAADSANPIRTLRHEAIHALRELGFFTDAQWNSLSKMAKDKWIDQYLKQRNIDGKPLKAGEESRYDAYMREYKGDMEKITEEAVADAFADFDVTKAPAGMLQAILQKLRNLFQSIKTALTKVEAPEKIFGKVEKGELKPEAQRIATESKSLRDQATDNFKRWFGDSKVLDIDGSPLVMYTGTSKDVDFTKFKIPKNGAWFTYDPKTASQYAKENDSKDIKYNPDTRKYEEVNTADRVMPVYLRIENPATLSKEDSDAMRYASNYRKVQGQIFDKLRAKGHDGVDMGDGVWVAIGQPTQIKSAIGNYGEYSLKDADIRKSLRTTPLQDGEQALDIIKSMGRTTEKPDESYKAKVQQAWNNAKDNPETTAKAVKDTLTRWSDQVQTWAFSSDAALNNSIRRAINETATTDAERTAFLLNTSLSQTVHADALASLFITEGNIKYNKDLHKWEAVKDKDNLVALVKGLEDISKKYNLSKEEAQLIGHTAFETKRLKSLVEFNDKVTQEVADMRKEAAQLRKEGKNRAADSLYEKATKRQKETKFIHMTDEEIASGNKLFDTIPELNNLVKTWNGIRSNAVKVLVETGLWSETDADFLLSNADYVPFFREDQLENGKGPKEFIRGLQVQAQEKKLKGSNKPVNDIFDNMVRWTQYSINRGVRNRSAVSLAEAAAEMGMARKVPVRAGNQNVVRIWKNGEEVLYSMADPMFIPAFTGLESVAIPSWKILSKFSNMLRQSVVMYPLFSISQVPQDSFAAIFTSGLKPQYALRIPVLAVKELIKTLAGKSKTHEELKKFGAVGVRDFTADMARVDAEVLAGLKMEKGLWSKVKGTLHHIAMASDNAVRQATYEAAMAQGLSQSEAIEKSFEVWNVRRKGSSQTLALAGQIIPFFNAYLAAQNVAFNVITGKGISPQKRADAYKTLAATTASVMTLSLLYTMMNGDDEDYENKPAVQRDRLLMIPGSGGMSIPLRSDLYTLPKIITEHTYLLMTDKGYEDGRKFRDSIKAALASSFLSPTTVPQAVKPLVEVGINYDFFTGRPIIGQFQKKLEVERQFNDSTAELAKALGSTGLVSPLNAEHLIRGMFGSVGGLILYATNPVLHSDPNVERPTLSAKEMLATLPGTSGFITRENQSALKNDFYVLRDEVAKVASTIADLKARSPEKLEEYLSSEEVIAKYGISKAVNKMVEQLGKIRKEMTRVTNATADVMTGEEKESTLKELRQVEKDMLKSINVKELRAAAGL